MPFPTVYGIPRGTSTGLLERLRRNIVKTVSDTMQVPQNWVRPLFVADLLDGPESSVDGANTIYARLDTAVFHDKAEVGEIARYVTASLAKVIWDAFEGRYEVEVFIGDLNPEWKTLLDARSDYPERLLAG